MDSLQARKVSSSLWAAYGDAMGFPTELVDAKGVERRIASSHMAKTVPWKRVVGGRFGSTASFNAGTYSDDTQLRLCTSRAIRDDGKFDVEAFSKIELPVWLCYALGAGRGSKAAASSLSNRGNAWFSNFFSSDGAEYVNGGGNGAAMRIQPHVWSARFSASDADLLRDVVRNAICTHGHPRGIAGAVIHAKSLAFVLREARLPRPAEWRELGNAIDVAAQVVEDDRELAAFWLPTWNSRSTKSFRDSMKSTRNEFNADIERAMMHLEPKNPHAYAQVVEALDGFSDSQRGSGLKAAILSLTLSWLHKDRGAEAAIVTGVNLLGSDTDTIGSMTGALMGCLVPDEHPSGELQDREYLVSETVRLHQISQRQPASSFAYPDLIRWSPPQSQLESVGTIGDRLALAGLGWLEPISEPAAAAKNDALWQWYRLDFGQTVLCKRREKVEPLSLPLFHGELSKTTVYQRPSELTGNQFKKKKTQAKAGELFLSAEAIPPSDRVPAVAVESTTNVDKLTDEAIRSDFDPALIGRHVLALCASSKGIELGIAYAAIVQKAWLARSKVRGATLPLD